MLAPVLPGETLKNALYQARVISDPVKNRVAGAHMEMYMFYVKFGDLDIDDQLRAMMVTPGYDPTALRSAPASVAFYKPANTVNWMEKCLNVIARAHFRDEGEESNDFLLDGLPTASINNRAWIDSLRNSASLPPETGADDWEKKYNVWLGMSQNKLTTATFEEWLAMSGVSTPDKLDETIADFKIPELIRYTREFAYPVGTVDPTTGLVASLWQWSLADRADKARFFTEPGFLVGLVVCRPKVYRKNLRGAATNYLDTAERWLPSVFDQDPHTSIFKHLEQTNEANTPIIGATAPYWIDYKDIFLHGDQFHNLATADQTSFVALPSITGTNKNYPALTDANGLFTTTGKEFLTCDGAFQLSIASRLVESTS